MHDHDKFFINGAWVGPSGRGSIEVIQGSS
jgi:hypothetical protein